MENNTISTSMNNMENSPVYSPDSYFQSRTIDQVFEDGLNTPRRKKIIGSFLYQNSTTFLFSRTNYGKSLLVFQFAFAAATGTNFDPCEALKNECPPMKVLVVDLELEALDITERHGPALTNMDPKHYANLFYLHEKLDQNVKLGYLLLDKIEAAALDHKAELVIIDNISKLLPDSLNAEMVTLMVDMLNRVRKNTGASILVIGHTKKENPKIAIQPTDYFGSSMLQNFFSEVSFLDMTKDGNFFLCHSKTKHSENYTQTVPVFTRGLHSTVGVGFTFQALHPLSEVQLPMSLISSNDTKKRSLVRFKNEIAILDRAGVKRTVIADLCNVNPSSITRVLEV